MSFQRPDSTANYGRYPSNYEQLVKEYIISQLIDPFSAVIQVSKPKKAYANSPLMYGGNVVWYGYIVNASVNAKNRYGGYTGWKLWEVPVQEDGLSKEKWSYDPVFTHVIE
jgi:hypothetical protein